MEDLEIKIRKYESKDKKSVREICCDTGFFGKPINQIFEDREVFADLILDPYLKREPENSFVAEHNNKLVGYLIGSTDFNFEISSVPYFLKNALKMLFKSTAYENPRSNKFVKWLWLRSLSEFPKHPKKSAHLHINLKENYRGKDIGIKMLQEYEKMLISKGIREYYGEVFSSDNKRSIDVYEKFGFKLYDKKRTTIFEPEIKELYITCIHKRLD